MSIQSVMPSNHLILCFFLLLPSIFPSIRVFSNESALFIRWSKCWSFSISPSNEYSELISFTIDWFDLLAVQETLKSLLQHHSSKHNSLALSLLYGPTLINIPTNSARMSPFLHTLSHIYCLEVSQKEKKKKILYIEACMWNLKKKLYRQSYLQSINRHRLREQMYGYQGGEERVG